MQIGNTKSKSHGEVLARFLVFVFTILCLPLAAQAAEASFPLIPDFKIFGILVAVFFVLIVPLNKVLIQPILTALEEREKRIDGARQNAEGVAAKAEEILQRYEAEIQAARIRTDENHKSTLSVARSEMMQVTAEARRFAEDELERARTEVSRALVSARSELQGHASRLAEDAAAKILGRTLS